jgi:hypothetical protein
MLTTWFIGSWLALGSGGSGDSPAAPVGDLGDAKKLRVLYAGVPGTPRATAFAEFLKLHFEQVGELDVTKLSNATAADWDVVIADGKRIYPMDDAKPSLDIPSVSLGTDFTKPIVMIGAMAGSVQHHTKIDWL